MRSCECACACVLVLVCLRACMCACVLVCLCTCVLACAYWFDSVWACACVLVCLCACVRVCLVLLVHARALLVVRVRFFRFLSHVVAFFLPHTRWLSNGASAVSMPFWVWMRSAACRLESLFLDWVTLLPEESDQLALVLKVRKHNNTPHTYSHLHTRGCARLNVINSR